MTSELEIISYSEHKLDSHNPSQRKRKRSDTLDRSRSKVKKTKIQEQVPYLPFDRDDEISPFHLQTSSLYVPLSPVSQKYPLEGMCAEHLSPLILTYYPPFNGLILSYSDPILSEEPFQNDGDTVLLKNVDEYGMSWGWLTADFLVLKPKKGTRLEGVISLQNDGFLGVVCWNLFNASIERSKLPRDWKWREAGDVNQFEDLDHMILHGEDNTGFYVDGQGKKIDGTIRFIVVEIESNQNSERGFLSIVGTMLSEEEGLDH
ncbi:DNA-directed RNA polymerase I subunit RPA43 [Erysiphe neolycopersici]|uniref:DNA-directed RNA polymerase subunit n=1 Tax=Erysiphe neolycopersici TaxID=212602 RepID=A0A420HIF9_9PEZI|nr:DNA-directed RNA polymerase I subunit RPA43 [Erysiphe neolycopersici]